MRSTIRNLFVAGVVIGLCATSDPAAAQGKSHKTDKVVHKSGKVVQKNDRVVTRRVSRTYTQPRVLCEDGVWVTRVANACLYRGGLAVRQGNYATTPRASARAIERAAPNSAVRRAYVNRIATNAIARCRDGTYWHATTRTGACYRHGGVARWL